MAQHQQPPVLTGLGIREMYRFTTITIVTILILQDRLKRLTVGQFLHTTVNGGFVGATPQVNRVGGTIDNGGEYYHSDCS